MISGNRVILTARLIHAASQENLWADSYERDLRDVLSLQSQMARTIGNQIQAVLTPETVARLGDPSPVDPDAYQLTLEGRYYANQLNQEALERSLRYFDDAIARDPTYAPAHAGKAFAYANLSSAYVPPREAMPRAKEAARRAIALDPDLAEAHTWLGFAHVAFDWDWSAGERELLRALELNPNSAEAHLAYAGYFLSQGEIDEALVQVRRTQELDPLSIMSYAGVNGSQWVLLMARRYDESIAEGRRALELEPDFSWAHANLGLALVANGQFANGVAELEEATRLEDSPLLKAFLSYGYAEAGRGSDARQLLAEVEAISRERYICAYEIAVTHAALGDADAAFEWLAKALEDKADCIPLLKIDPRLDTLRPDPRFQELVDRVGFELPTAALIRVPGGRAGVARS